ncbi:unnamed protein product [Paramecium pentaurelia]|uniref:Uncharacterized protein n=1 Tax=Paramecium pentaurelia TaxID=43138 RepID=A0A8S1XD70_9CILI|nr:unnamed protein product [Paramecium pentaurelia]
MQVNKCMFCDKLNNDGSFHLILTRALYCKYSQSQNFYYEKDINDILDDKQVKSTIRFKDYVQLDEPTEFMRRFYRYFESDDRIPALLEYYKYHINIPRNFHCKVINKRMEKNREIQYCKIKMELGLFEEVKQQTQSKIKDTSEDCSVSQLKYLLRDLKIESTQTDISKISNTTVLRDLVHLIGDTKIQPKPFQIFNQNKLIQKSLKPTIDAQRQMYQNYQGTLKKTIEMQLKQAQQLKSPPLTQRIPKPIQTSRQTSAQKQRSKIEIPIKTIKKPPQLKSRQASLGNIEMTKSCLTTARNTPQQNELLLELAKKMFSTKMTFNNSNQKKKLEKQQQNNFFVKGRTSLAGSQKNFEDLKNSMRSLRSRHLTPSQICSSNHGTPKTKKKMILK